jgi:RluA family pseudouridine synthase
VAGEAPQRWAQHVVREEEAGATVREILRGPLALSGRLIQRLTRSKGVMLNRRPAFLDRRVRAGDLVTARVAADEEPGLPPVEMPLSVVLEDADLLVLDKPAGLLVHPTGPAHTRTLAHGVAHHLLSRGVHARVRPVHRIDRDTSGLVLFAKSARAQGGLDAQLREHRLRRTYLALVAGAPPEDEGVVDAPIGAHPRNPTLRAVRTGGEPARTRYRVVERVTDAALLELELETGRTHQIRVHLQHLGCPVLGDRWYGSGRVAGLDRPALHAHRLEFLHPIGGAPVEVSAPLPSDLAAVLERLRADRETNSA